MLREYDFREADKWAREMSLKDARQDIERKHKETVKCLSVSFKANVPFSSVEKLMAWLETGLRVCSNEEGYEITDRKIEERRRVRNPD